MATPDKKTEDKSPSPEVEKKEEKKPVVDMFFQEDEDTYNKLEEMKSIKVVENEIEECKTIIEFKKKKNFGFLFWDERLPKLNLLLEELKNSKPNDKEYISILKNELKYEYSLYNKLTKNHTRAVKGRILKRISILKKELSDFGIKDHKPNSFYEKYGLIITHLAHCTHPNGNHYIGEVNGYKLEGFGVLKYYIGACYRGQWKQDKYNGLGHYDFQFENGEKQHDMYEGEYTNGKCNGYGIYHYSTGGTDEGDWVNGKRIGYGIITFPDGEKYQGEWLNGYKHGVGITWYANGFKYEGEWVKGLFHGYGILHFSSKERYAGQWKKDKKDGYGEYYYSNGDVYIGQWKEGKGEGTGVAYYKNGDIYRGEYVDANQEGYGEYYYVEGHKYKGEIKKNKFEGYGIFYHTDKTVYRGEWKNSFREGYGVLIDPKKKIKYSGQWKIIK